MYIPSINANEAKIEFHKQIRINAASPGDHVLVQQSPAPFLGQNPRVSLRSYVQWLSDSQECRS